MKPAAVVKFLLKIYNSTSLKQVLSAHNQPIHSVGRYIKGGDIKGGRLYLIYPWKPLNLITIGNPCYNSGDAIPLEYMHFTAWQLFLFVHCKNEVCIAHQWCDFRHYNLVV